MKKTEKSYFLVIGLGASGVSMSKFLHSKGKTVVATDIDDSKAETAKGLNTLGIKTQIGFHDQKTFNQASIMVPSPGIPLTNPFITQAHRQGVPITGELDIFTKYNDLPIIAITGTNGKTTTTTLIGEILKQSGMNPFVGGNIGPPLMDHLISKETADVIVAEISSFQLDISNQFKPDIGVLLNISEDHLDRYENYKTYENSKWHLFKNQTSSDTAVINLSIKGVNKASDKLKSKILTFSTDKKTQTDSNAAIGLKSIEISMENHDHRIETDHLKELIGSHNRENIAAAALACLAFGADLNGILNGLKHFNNLPHRMAFVKTINGISFYNDSKATNTDAVLRAIECFKENIILVMGGREKDTDFSLLVNVVRKHVKTIIALGESRDNIKDTFENICLVKKVKTMKEAVETAFNLAFKNNIVLLSPACASFDMYKSYAHRGDDFITCVNELENN